MQKQYKNTSQQIKELALCLHNIALYMQLQYRKISVIAFVEVLSLVVNFVFLRFESIIICKLGSVALTVSLLFVVDIVTMIGYVMLRRIGISFRHSYKKGLEILQTMADKSEWTRYKRKLIYRGDNENMSNAVDIFFSLSEKKWSPCRSEKRYYIILMLIIPFSILCSILAFILKAIFIIS